MHVLQFQTTDTQVPFGCSWCSTAERCCRSRIWSSNRYCFSTHHRDPQCVRWYGAYLVEKYELFIRYIKEIISFDYVPFNWNWCNLSSSFLNILNLFLALLMSSWKWNYLVVITSTVLLITCADQHWEYEGSNEREYKCWSRCDAIRKTGKPSSHLRYRSS